jgi:lycopene cyclase domain-containing protein
MNHFEYLLVLLFSGFIPFLFTFHPHSKIKKHLEPLFKAIFISAIPWIIWDIWATWRGHWGFNPDYILGLKFINLPIEEVAFFIVIPFCSIFVWTLIRDFKDIKTFVSQMLNLK